MNTLFILYSVYTNKIILLRFQIILFPKKNKFKEKHMAKSDLLKEAIADAKAVKETALANAKIALQEAFRPRVEAMLAKELQNEIDGEEEATDAAAAAGPETDAMGAEVTADVDDDGDFTWTDDTLSASVGSNDYSFRVGMAGEDEEEEVTEPVAAPAQASDEEMTAEYNEGDDLNIESILRELEGDLNSDEMAEGYGEDDEEIGMGMPMEGYKKLSSSRIGKGSRKLTEEDMLDDSDDVTVEGDEMSDAALEEIIEAILREEEDSETSMKMNPNTMSEEDKDEMIEAMEDELGEKEEELKEAYRTVKQLQSVINEVNLLNAKLLYTNKLFRNFELSEPQKMKVIENFDRAANTREAKLVFATLAESFKRPTKKRVVKESYASRPITTTAPRVETTKVLSEGFELANRWKKLAGLL
jgi:hypothetical protein